MCACLLRSISPLLPPSIPSAPSSWIPLLYFTMAYARMFWLHPIQTSEFHHAVLYLIPYCTQLSLLNDAILHYTVIWYSIIFHPIYHNVPCYVLSVCWSLFLTQTVWATLWCIVFVPGTYCICRSLLDSWLDHTSLHCATLYFAVWLCLLPAMVAVCKSYPLWTAKLSAFCPVRWDVLHCTVTVTLLCLFLSHTVPLTI